MQDWKYLGLIIWKRYDTKYGCFLRPRIRKILIVNRKNYFLRKDFVVRTAIRNKK